MNRQQEWGNTSTALSSAGHAKAAAEEQTGRPFRRDRLERLAQLERWHFWFVGRQALIERLLAKHGSGRDPFLLDLGCGTGFFLGTLLQRGYRAVGLDARPEGLQATRRAFPTSLLLRAEAASLPLKGNAFAGVLLVDVLEHVDDLTVLKEVHRVLRPGGWVLITAPAMSWLWSYRDVDAGHRRRYSRRQLRSLLGAAQLNVREMRYYQCLLFPLVILTRLLGCRGPRWRDLEEKPPRFANSVLTWIGKLEVLLGAFMPWPWGSSLVIMGRKTDAE